MRIIIIGLFVIFIGVLGFRQTTNTRAGLVLVQAPPLVTKTLAIGGTNIAVEIADTDTARAHGLSGRAALPENTGMLFIFDESQTPGFWMKDMRFPIDIVWIDENWKIVGLNENVAPETYPIIFYPPELINYVLEVNAGFIVQHHITVGTQAVQH